MRLKTSPMEDPDLDFGTPAKVPHQEVVCPPDIAQPFAGKEVAKSLPEPDLLIEERCLVGTGLTGNPGAFGIVDRGIITPVLVQPADLPPVDAARLISFPVEHVGVDPADGEPAVVDGAPAAGEEDAGAVRSRPEGVARYVEPPLLIAGVEVRRRDDGVRRKRADPVGVVFEEEDVTVELAGAAPAAAVAGEPDLPDDLDELLFGKLEKQFAFLLEGLYLFVKRERKAATSTTCPAGMPGPVPSGVGRYEGYVLWHPLDHGFFPTVAT